MTSRRPCSGGSNGAHPPGGEKNAFFCTAIFAHAKKGMCAKTGSGQTYWKKERRFSPAGRRSAWRQRCRRSCGSGWPSPAAAAAAEAVGKQQKGKEKEKHACSFFFFLHTFVLAAVSKRSFVHLSRQARDHTQEKRLKQKAAVIFRERSRFAQDGGWRCGWGQGAGADGGDGGGAGRCACCGRLGVH
eukprot:COSAG06_NODE_3972_length_4702_cov_5.129046_4_plen_187_part_00